MRKNGFTLLELMVVVAIITVLTSMALPALINMGSRKPTRTYFFPAPLGSYNSIALYNPSNVAVSVSINIKAIGTTISGVPSVPVRAPHDTSNPMLAPYAGNRYALCAYNPMAPAFPVGHSYSGACYSQAPQTAIWNGACPPNSTSCSVTFNLGGGDARTIGYFAEVSTYYGSYGGSPKSIETTNSNIGAALRLTVNSTDSANAGYVVGTLHSFDDSSNTKTSIPLMPANQL